MTAKFFIFGDSHAGALTRAARAMKVDFAGGSIMAGEYMNEPFFEVKDGVFTMLSDLGKERLDLRLKAADLANLLDAEMPFLCTVGFNTHTFDVPFRAQRLAIKGSEGARFVSRACFDAMVRGAHRGAFAFYETLVGAGKTVLAVRAPQRFLDGDGTIWRAHDLSLMAQIEALGVTMIDITPRTTDETGYLLPKFISDKPGDRVHANVRYGRAVIRRALNFIEG